MPVRRIGAVAGRSVATVSPLLAGLGLSRLKSLDPVQPIIRYEREAPGELLHMDIKSSGASFGPVTASLAIDATAWTALAGSSPMWPSTISLASLLVLTCILATLSWRYIELPIRQRRDLWSNKRVSWSAVLTALACIAFTLTNVATKGLPQRFPDYVQRAFPAVAVDTPRPECFRDENSKKKAAEQFCLFGNKSTSDPPALLLWGDSHANQYLDPLMQATRRHGIVGAIATQAECQSTKTEFTADAKPGDGSNCEQFNIEVNQFIDRTPSIKTVVLGRLWRNGSNFANAIELTKSLIASGKKVILVGPLPAGTYNVPDHWSLLQLHAGHRIDDMTVTLRSQDSALKMLTLLKSDLAVELRSGRLILINQFQTLCSGEKCYLVRDGVAIIRDWTHLSQAGSLLFVSEFAAALDN